MHKSYHALTSVRLCADRRPGDRTKYGRTEEIRNIPTAQSRGTIVVVKGGSSVFSNSDKHFRRVVRARASVPQCERTRNVTLSSGKFCGKCDAARVKTYSGIAQRAQEVSGEPELARYLTHYLHQTPGNRSRDFLRGRQTERRNIARPESGLVTYGMRIPSGLLLDNRTDECGIEFVPDRDGTSKRD